MFIQSFLEILSSEENTVRLFYGLKFVIRNSLVLNNIIEDLYLVETLKLRERPTADVHGTSWSFSFMLLVLRVKKKRLFLLIRPWNTSLPNESRLSRGLTGYADLPSRPNGYFFYEVHSVARKSDTDEKISWYMLLLWSRIIRSGKCIEAEPRAKQSVILWHTISDFHYPNSERKPFCSPVKGQCYGNKNFTKSKMSCNSGKALSIAEEKIPCHNRTI